MPTPAFIIFIYKCLSNLDIKVRYAKMLLHPGIVKDTEEEGVSDVR
jgi:hypothetical protein